MYDGRQNVQNNFPPQTLSAVSPQCLPPVLLHPHPPRPLPASQPHAPPASSPAQSAVHGDELQSFHPEYGVNVD